MNDPGRAEPLEDFPLQGELGLGAPRVGPGPEKPEAAEVFPGGAAPLGPRLSAAAADAAAVLLLTAVALLGARLVTGQSPRLSGIPWALGFLVYLSLFATVPALVLFGRTVGMAISDLSARDGGDAGVPADAALRRWAGTLATAATGGLLLLWTRASADAPTPADRLSGCPLSLD
jgi:hypothetical protein